MSHGKIIYILSDAPWESILLSHSSNLLPSLSPRDKECWNCASFARKKSSVSPHVLYIFNCFGILLESNNAHSILYCSTMSSFIPPEFMTHFSEPTIRCASHNNCSLFVAIA